MRWDLITSAKASVIIAVAGIVTEMLFRDSQPGPATTPAAQGRAEGGACGTVLIHAVGIIAAILALRAVSKEKLPKVNLYVALGGLILNLAAGLRAAGPLWQLL